MANFPMAVDPARMGLNITPYDNDNTAAAGSTTLRHIDNSARLAWSTFGSVQSDPYRWGRATLPGYTPPADRPTTPRTPTLEDPLDSADSPQTIAQSARNGVPISGRDPAPASRGITVTGANLAAGELQLNLTAAGPGRAHVFLYDVNPIDGNKSYTRVWNTSCDPATNPAPDYGLSACAHRRRHDAAVGAGHDGRHRPLASWSTSRPRARARSPSRSTPRPRCGWRAAPRRSCPSPRRRTRCRRSTCRSPPRAAAWAARCRRRSRSRSALRPRSARSRRASRGTTSRPRPRP